MIFKIKKKKKSFTQIDNGPIDDTELSPSGLGALLYLLSKPPTWKAHKKELLKRFTNTNEKCKTIKTTKNKIDSIFIELRSAGYLQVKPIKGKGGHLKGTEYTIFEEKQPVKAKPKRNKDNLTEVPTSSHLGEIESTEVPTSSEVGRSPRLGNVGTHSNTNLISNIISKDSNKREGPSPEKTKSKLSEKQIQAIENLKKEKAKKVAAKKEKEKTERLAAEKAQAEKWEKMKAAKDNDWENSEKQILKWIDKNPDDIAAKIKRVDYPGHATPIKELIETMCEKNKKNLMLLSDPIGFYQEKMLPYMRFEKKITNQKPKIRNGNRIKGQYTDQYACAPDIS